MPINREESVSYRGEGDVRTRIQVLLPILILIASVCGVILVLGFVSGGAIAGLAVFIPCVILGSMACVSMIIGTILAQCVYREDEGGVRIRTSRPSRSTVQRRMEIVGRLPHVEDNGEGDTSCSICLGESPPERVVLNCGHMFHEDCVKEWMSRARFARCPLCRSGLGNSSPAGRFGIEQPSGDVTPLERRESDCPPIGEDLNNV